MNYKTTSGGWLDLTELHQKAEELKKCPEVAAAFAKANQELFEDVFRPEYTCDWAHLRLQRDGDLIAVQWHSARGPGHQYHVVASALQIAYFAQDRYGDNLLLPTHKGDGATNMRLQQGSSYYFRFRFVEEGVSRCPQIAFQLGIPLSPERSAALYRALHEKSVPGDEVLRKLDEFRAFQSGYDNKCKEIIAEINSQDLPPEERDAQVERFTEYAKRLRLNSKM